MKYEFHNETTGIVICIRPYYSGVHNSKVIQYKKYKAYKYRISDLGYENVFKYGIVDKDDITAWFRKHLFFKHFRIFT